MDATTVATASGTSGQLIAALLGRPNVGKSTLLNRLAGQKYSITSNKAQTTRRQIILPDKNNPGILWLDTPGIDFRHQHALHRAMHRNAMAAAHDSDIKVFMVEAMCWQPEDERIWQQLRQGAEAREDILMVINKCDKIRDKSRLLPYVANLQNIQGMKDIKPLFLAARSGAGVQQLITAVESVRALANRTTVAPVPTAKDSWRFLAAELMREQLVRRLADELPHQLYVETTGSSSSANLARFELDIVVATKGQKAIVIGRRGAMLKQVGTMVRQQLEQRLGRKVYIGSTVKVHANWFNDPERLTAATVANG